MIQYQEYPPCAALAPYLACLWTCQVRLDRQSISHRVLPDNCIDILWQDCDAHGGVAGMMSTLIEVPVHRTVRTIAVRFKPGAAAFFFDLPLNELTDLHPALDELWEPGVAAQFADALWTRPLSDAQALAALQRLLLKRLHLCRPPSRVVDAAIETIEASKGTIRIESLADALGVSRQHLASQFRARVGLGAKQFARICRFQHASARIRVTDPHTLDWTALALDLGYYDQPHMIHEFHALAGALPQSFTRAD